MSTAQLRLAKMVHWMARAVLPVRLSVHQPPFSAWLLAQWRLHSVKRFRLLWSGHRSASQHYCCLRGEGRLPLTSLPLISNGHSVFLRPGHDLKSYLKPEKASSGKRFIAVLGEVHLPCWRFNVVRHGGNVRKDGFSILLDLQLKPIPPRTGSSQMVSHLLQCPGSHGDVFIVNFAMVPKGLDRAGSFRSGVTDKHSLFQKSVFQGLFDWDLLYKQLDPLCGESFLSCSQVLEWHHCHQFYTSCSA